MVMLHASRNAELGECKHLGGDRFAHIVTCVRAYLDAPGAGQ